MNIKQIIQPMPLVIIGITLWALSHWITMIPAWLYFALIVIGGLWFVVKHFKG